jgi:hypothetical protein
MMLANISEIPLEGLGPDEGQLPPAEEAESGLDIHAGRSETSVILFLRPDLVSPDHRAARFFPGRTFEELRRIAEAPDAA